MLFVDLLFCHFDRNTFLKIPRNPIPCKRTGPWQIYCRWKMPFLNVITLFSSYTHPTTRNTISNKFYWYAISLELRWEEGVCRAIKQDMVHTIFFFFLGRNIWLMLTWYISWILHNLYPTHHFDVLCPEIHMT